MQVVTQEEFFRIQSRFGYVPFTQTQEWLDGNPLDAKIVYFVDSAEDAKICCFGYEYRKRGLGSKLMIPGDTYSDDISSSVVRDFYCGILGMEYDAVELSNLCPYNARYEIGVRQAGLVRPLRASLCPMTIMVDLNDPKPSGSWCRNVRKASETLSFRWTGHPAEEDFISFCRMFDELKAVKGLGFSVKPAELKPLFSQGRYFMFFASNANGEDVAARLVYVMGELAYDIYAANSFEARKCNATYFIMHCVFDWLKERGVKHFDFGRIAPDTGSGNSVYEFKSYSGGMPVAYNGQWSFYKSRMKELLLFFLNYIIRKGRRY